MALFPFMSEPTPATDDGVAAFVDSLPRGDGKAGCAYLWFAYEQSHDIDCDAFEAACRATGRTETIYGREYLTGIDEQATKEWFLSQF